MTKHIFDCIDAHTCGNPVRLILSQKPDLSGTSMSQKRSDFIKNFDWIRKSLMFEPRGHDIMSGGMIFPPNDPNNDFSILFFAFTELVDTGVIKKGDRNYAAITSMPHLHSELLDTFFTGTRVPEPSGWIGLEL